MLILAKATLALMIGFVLSAFSGIVLIPQLKKIKARQNISIFLKREHGGKQGIPTIGGLIFIIPTIISIIILIALGKIEYSTNLMIVLITFILYGLLGFLDDYLSIKKGNNISNSCQIKNGNSV